MTDKKTKLSSTTPDPFVGRSFDGYRIERLIGRGGMGAVYQATQLSLNRPVAIKVLPEDVCQHEQFVERFHREVDILSRLSHPNIVTVFERGEVDGRLYLVMEYVEGTSLRDVIKAGPLPSYDALVIVRSVLSALEHAHDRGIVHRDIKPENVLVAPGSIVKVADFGLSRLVEGEDATRLTHTHLMLGTFEYMSPEQREKAKEADERSDLYATGVVLYELLAGELPIGKWESLSAKRPKECDSRIDDIVEKSLQKSPEQRFQRASEMGQAVSRLLTPAPVAPAPPAPPRPVVAGEPRAHRNGIGAMGVGFAGFLGTLLVTGALGTAVLGGATALIVGWLVLPRRRRSHSLPAILVALLVLVPVLFGTLFLFWGVRRVPEERSRMEAASIRAAFEMYDRAAFDAMKLQPHRNIAKWNAMPERAGFVEALSADPDLKLWLAEVVGMELARTDDYRLVSFRDQVVMLQPEKNDPLAKKVAYAYQRAFHKTEFEHDGWISTSDYEIDVDAEFKSRVDDTKPRIENLRWK